MRHFLSVFVVFLPLNRSSTITAPRSMVYSCSCWNACFVYFCTPFRTERWCKNRNPHNWSIQALHSTHGEKTSWSLFETSIYTYPCQVHKCLAFAEAATWFLWFSPLTLKCDPSETRYNLPTKTSQQLQHTAINLSVFCSRCNVRHNLSYKLSQLLVTDQKSQ